MHESFSNSDTNSKFSKHDFVEMFDNFYGNILKSSFQDGI